MNLFITSWSIALCLLIVLFPSIAERSKLLQKPPFQYAHLAIAWYPSFCQIERVKCNEPIWTIHGFFDQHPKSVKFYPKFISDHYKGDRFQPKLLLDDVPLYEELRTKWKDLEGLKPPMGLWAHQWIKHGKYFRYVQGMRGQNAFFSGSLKLYNNLHMDDLTQVLEILETIEEPISLRDVKKAVMDLFHVDVIIICAPWRLNEEADMLLEIRICYNNRMIRVNCSHNIDQRQMIKRCNHEHVIFPLTSEGDECKRVEITREDAEKVAQEKEMIIQDAMDAFYSKRQIKREMFLRQRHQSQTKIPDLSERSPRSQVEFWQQRRRDDSHESLPSKSSSRSDQHRKPPERSQSSRSSIETVPSQVAQSNQEQGEAEEEEEQSVLASCNPAGWICWPKKTEPDEGQIQGESNIDGPDERGRDERRKRHGKQRIIRESEREDGECSSSASSSIGRKQSVERRQSRKRRSRSQSSHGRRSDDKARLSRRKSKSRTKLAKKSKSSRRRRRSSKD